MSGVGNALPELLERVVYVRAHCCVDPPDKNAYLAEPENAESLIGQVAAALVGDPAAPEVARVDWDTPGDRTAFRPFGDYVARFRGRRIGPTILYSSNRLPVLSACGSMGKGKLSARADYRLSVTLHAFLS
ncbi:hypothetical protein [Allonocardiopsis opalescens]|uniref:Uncharacterized protein n=1 Tax=Allonocardiopsis opalescens TaxID=1144618 RepID=A0A2T0PYS0_9ACTN|nr:hypothetical protein [Allonocardiopsis opalescens]PRX96691.1 hypothetical protein CLV72_107214 [Allonocardiopsis opalescens]